MTKHPILPSTRSSSDSFRSSQDTSGSIQDKEAMRHAHDVTETLRSSLRKLALEKQTLASQMQRCQASNGRLIQQLALEHADFEARTLRMQHEISVIRSNVVDAKTELIVANGDMRENLQSAARTTMRLSLMFLRMRQAKLRAEHQSLCHEKLSQKLKASSREHAEIIQNMQNPFENESESRYLLFEAHKRIGDLLQRNALLQVRLNADQVQGKFSRQSRKMTRRLLRQLAKELYHETAIRDAKGRRTVVYGRQRISRRLHADLVADPDITVFKANGIK